MKILIATDTYYPHVNGASYFTQRLARGLMLRGHEVRVLAPSRGYVNERYVKDGVTVEGIRSFPVMAHTGYRSAFPVGISKSVGRVFDQFTPDVVHLQGHFFINRAARRHADTRGIPIVGTNHFMPENLVHYLPVPASVRRAVVRAAWHDFCSVFSSLDAVTTPTKTAADLMHRVGFRGDVTAISCGVDLGRFQGVEKRTSVRSRYSISDDTTLFLYVGRLDREKNIDLLLRAFAASDARNSHFLVVGKGHEGVRLAYLTRELGISSRVTFAGFVPDADLPSVYCAADCFLIAGTAELQSIVTMEAMVAGLPVIGVRAVALPELIHHDSNGFLFEHGDERAVASFMDLLARDAQLRAQMGARSLEIIAQHEISRSLAAYEEIYVRVSSRAGLYS